MRIFFFGNNELAVRVMGYLKRVDAEIVGLCVHPPARAIMADRLIELAGLPSESVFEAESLRDSATIDAIRELKPDLGISIKFAYVLKPELFDVFPQQCINLHTSFLPHNRGMNPNVWALVEGTPAGATLHVIDKGVDTGPILSQVRVDVTPTDTAKTLYHKLDDAAYDLFERDWPRFRARQLRPQVQVEVGTSHMRKDFGRLRQIEADKMYRAADLINILRACTFPPYPGASVEIDGRKVCIRIELQEE